MIGVDVGLTDMAAFSTGEKIPNPKRLARSAKRLRRAYQALSRKEKGAKNREKARRKVARLHARITDQRLDGLHKLTTRLIRENQTTCVEALAVKHMVLNPHLAKAISDVGWGVAKRQLEYKAAWYGRRLVKVDRWYPSSERRHGCGYIVEALRLGVRRWTCPHCGDVHERELNAAKNLLAVGLTVSAFGESVRPAKASARVGASQ
jgi:putative transposase